ncbi:four helix bundle protein [Niabella pedocola]|uniref:Four helix bundle protein n=1 Tax=Niabella pedocola TaxID=1752077 RepID=A0ABS8PWZ5_9BACT|nr:four helix bundle protein [Niabella pedocola]MCD2424853.1 four helix bundle protein [Niabella pedocola]
MKSYRDLNIYREAHRLAIEIHRISLQLPKFECFEEGSQIRRSSKAVSTAIVEGYGRKRYKAEFIRYLTYAHTECDETIEHLDYLFETKSLTDKEGYETVRENYTGLSKQINKFIDWVENNWNNYPSAE